MHKSHPRSQVSIFYMSLCGQVDSRTKRPDQTSSHERPQMTLPNEFTWAPSNDLPKQVYIDTLK